MLTFVNRLYKNYKNHVQYFCMHVLVLYLCPYIVQKYKKENLKSRLPGSGVGIFR